MVQVSHPYMTTGKNIALTKQNFVGKVMSLLFNVLSRLVTFFSSKEEVSFNFITVVTICSDIEGKIIKFLTVSIGFPSICNEMVGLGAIS